MASPGYINPGGLTPISGFFANPVIERPSFSFACSSQPKSADLTAGSTQPNVLDVPLQIFKQQKIISQVPLIHHF